MKPIFYIDDNLRMRAEDPNILLYNIDMLKKKLSESDSVDEKVKIFGELGVYFDCMDLFTEAEGLLVTAIELIQKENLGIAKEVQQKIRLATVYQHMGKFEKSNPMFRELLKICESDEETEVYYDFVLQHAGKNFFDQGELENALEFFEKTLKIRMKKQSPEDQIESTKLAIEITKEKL